MTLPEHWREKNAWEQQTFHIVMPYLNFWSFSAFVASDLGKIGFVCC